MKLKINAKRAVIKLGKNDIFWIGKFGGADSLRDFTNLIKEVTNLKFEDTSKTEYITKEGPASNILGGTDEDSL